MTIYFAYVLPLRFHLIHYTVNMLRHDAYASFSFLSPIHTRQTCCDFVVQWVQPGWDQAAVRTVRLFLGKRWTLICFDKWSLRANFFSHTGHWYGFTPEWDRRWRDNSSERENLGHTHIHRVHLCRQSNGFANHIWYNLSNLNWSQIIPKRTSAFHLPILSTINTVSVMLLLWLQHINILIGLVSNHQHTYSASKHELYSSAVFAWNQVFSVQIQTS